MKCSYFCCQLLLLQGAPTIVGMSKANNNNCQLALNADDSYQFFAAFAARPSSR
jgi:hypothetical protein